MNTSAFKHNDLRFYVQLLFDLAGKDVSYMVQGFESVPQATRETVEKELNAEDTRNSEDMINYWMMVDKALEAVGMRESKGYNTNYGVSGYYNQLRAYARQRTEKKAYIGIARTNAEQAKAHLYNVPLSFEVVPNKPGQDIEAIKFVNYYRDEILNQNNWDYERKAALADANDFGCGAWIKCMEEHSTGFDVSALEERILNGEIISWAEFNNNAITHPKHVVKHVPIFELIQDRRAKGEAGMYFENGSHTILTRMECVPVVEAKVRYPEYAEQISEHISDLQARTNPAAYQENDSGIQTTKKTTWVSMPVSYTITAKIAMTDGNVEEVPIKKQRNVIVEFVRIEGAGIVEVHVDKYAHGSIPVTKVVRRPSKHHAYGVGIYRDMYSSEWAYNLAYNGKYNWFRKMSQTRVFYKKGTLTKAVLDKPGDVHYIELDLDPHSQQLPINELIYERPPLPIPSMYDNLERSGEEKVDRTSGWATHSGMAVGNSGRQQAIMANNSETGQQGIVSNLEAAFKPLADKFYSDIIQFDGDREIRFLRTDPVNNTHEEVVLNEDAGQYETYNETTGDYELYTHFVKNGIKSLEYSTQVATRSFLPSNPTELRFYLQDNRASIFPMLQDPVSLAYLEWENQMFFGGIYSDLIEKAKMQFSKQEEQQRMQFLMEMNRMKDRDEMDDLIKRTELGQDKFRLEEKAKADMIKANAALLQAMKPKTTN